MKACVLGNYMNVHFLNVDRLPGPGDSLMAQRVFQEHGGKGLNLGLRLHRLSAALDASANLAHRQRFRSTLIHQLNLSEGGVEEPAGGLGIPGAGLLCLYIGLGGRLWRAPITSTADRV